jgi:hypothetical protein
VAGVNLIQNFRKTENVRTGDLSKVINKQICIVLYLQDSASVNGGGKNSKK